MGDQLEDWAEIRRLYRAGEMPIRAIPADRLAAGHDSALGTGPGTSAGSSARRSGAMDGLRAGLFHPV